MKKALAGFWVLVFALAAFGQERFVRPVDEASKDASFLAFRTKLIAAAERKDLKYVMGVMDPKIKLSFGGHEGLKGFRELYPKEEEFWEAFLPVITRGGKWLSEPGSPKIFSAPYTFSAFPDDLDAFEHHVIFGSNVNVREQPNTNAKVVAQLSYNIVKTDREATINRKTGPGEWDLKADWYKIESLGGVKGWVKAEYVRSPIDLRAGFEKKRGKWTMIYFISGD